MKVGTEIKGLWDWEDNFWILNSSDSTILLTASLLIFTSSFLAHIILDCKIFRFYLFVVENISSI